MLSSLKGKIQNSEINYGFESVAKLEYRPQKRQDIQQISVKMENEETPEIHPYSYNQLNFSQQANISLWGKKAAFNSAGIIGSGTRPLPHTSHKSQLPVGRDLKIQPDHKELFEKSIRETLQGIGIVRL